MHVQFLPSTYFLQVGFKAKPRTTTTDLERNGLNIKCNRKDQKVKVDHRLARSVSRGCSKSNFSWPGSQAEHFSEESGKANDPRMPQTQPDIHKDRIRGFW